MPEDLAAGGGGGAAVGMAVGCAGTAVGAGLPLVDGTEVGEALGGTAVADADAGIGGAVAEEPQANMAANSNAKGPKTINFGFLNQCFNNGRTSNLVSGLW